MYYYAHYRIKLRKTTPRSKEFLEIYKDKARDCLKKDDRDNKLRMMTLNDVLHSKAILRKEPYLLEIEGQKAVRELLVLKYLADYGDYMADICKPFRDLAIEHKTDGVIYIIGKTTWIEVQKKLDVEHQAYLKWAKSGGKAEYVQPTTDAINVACGALGFEIETILHAIKWYSERNSNMHSEVGTKIKNHDWDGLGARLWADKRKLTNLFGEEEFTSMKKALEMVETRYFAEICPLESVTSEYATGLIVARHEKRRKQVELAKPPSRKVKEVKEPRQDNRKRPTRDCGFYPTLF